MELTIDKTGDSGILKIEGELTIQKAESLKQALMGALDKMQVFRLDLNSLTRIDLAAIQLLYSAHKSAEAAGKTIELADGANDLFKNGVEAAGYGWHKWLCFGQV